jgi:hypothetical protein
MVWVLSWYYQQLPNSVPSGSPGWLTYGWWVGLVIWFSVNAALWLVFARRQNLEGVNTKTVANLKDAVSSRDTRIEDLERVIESLKKDLANLKLEYHTLVGLDVKDLTTHAEKAYQSTIRLLEADNKILCDTVQRLERGVKALQDGRLLDPDEKRQIPDPLR